MCSIFVLDLSVLIRPPEEETGMCPRNGHRVNPAVINNTQAHVTGICVQRCTTGFADQVATVRAKCAPIGHISVQRQRASHATKLANRFEGKC